MGPPEDGRSRPGQAAPPNATDVESTTLHELRMFEWRECPVHPWLRASVIVVADSLPLCVLPGGGYHLAEPDRLQVAA